MPPLADLMPKRRKKRGPRPEDLMAKLRNSPLGNLVTRKGPGG